MNLTIDIYKGLNMSGTKSCKHPIVVLNNYMYVCTSYHMEDLKIILNSNNPAN